MPNPKVPLSVKRGTQSGQQEQTALRTALADANFYLPFFHFLTIPKNTSQAAYISYRMPFPISQVSRLWVEFPLGCKGLVGVQLWRGVEQIFPLPAGLYLKSDGATLNFQFTHLIDKEPYEIELRGYNLDDTYQHIPWFGFELRGLNGEPSPQLQSFLDTLKVG